MKLNNLKILSVTNPIGITERPYFSYIMTSSNQNVWQRKYEIAVTCAGKMIWHTSKETKQSTFIFYEGELKSKTRYEVAITVTDNYGESDTISGFFETSFLDKREWKGQWVKSSLPVFEAEKGFGKQPPATMFKKKFICNGDVLKARLYATCHGIYSSYINGKRFDKGEFAPEHSTYKKVLFYQTYDVTNALCQGENTFSMYVGDGWYLGVKTTPQMENYERRHAVLFQLEIEYQNGEKQVIVSDEEVKCAYGKVLSSDLFAGERYDANKEFADWRNAETAEYCLDNLAAQYDPLPICVDEIPVQSIIITPKGETILDFGKVLAGRVRMKVSEGKGQKITLTHSEMLDKDGNFFQSAEMPDGGVEQMDEYICDGTRAEYEPLFTYHGFRYVKVEGVSDLNKENFTAKVYSSPKDNLGEFYCSDERLNQLYKNIRNSQRSNMLSIPTDCPQREKAGWTGDIGIYVRTALLNEDITAFLNRWLLSVRADQGENGAIPIVVPYDGGYPMTEMFFGEMFEEKGTFGSAGWGDACVLVPWAVYQITGNTYVLRKNMDVMERWCEYILKRCKLPCKDRELPKEYDNYLWNRGYHQGDWLVPSMAKQPVMDPIFDVLKQQNFTAQYAAPMYAYHTFEIMTEIVRVIGDAQKESHYMDVAGKMKAAIQNVLFDEKGNLPTDLMGAYVLAVAFELVPKEKEAYVKERLVRLLEENGGCLDTGFLSTPYVLKAFESIGRRDLAYALLFQTKCPSWLYEVEKGATAIWESWDSFEEDGNPKKISFNHYAFGCVDDWIFQNLCGIVPSVGFQSVRIEPKLDCGLNHVVRHYQTGYGELSVEWKTEQEQFVLICDIPCNTTAEIVLPNGVKQRKGSGRYIFRGACR